MLLYANVESDELEIPELSAGWFERALQPNRRSLRRGSKRAVFIAEEVAFVPTNGLP
ncbi:MAG TPA: hypothetical protein VN894_10420 [Polyangiaceae bacterium]|nr:hypothetical protein [Polyangiaceae bacterium]